MQDVEWPFWLIFCTRLVDSLLPLELLFGSWRIPDRQAKKSSIPCANFGGSRFPGSRQIPNPIKIFCLFLNPTPSNPGSREYPSRPCFLLSYFVRPRLSTKGLLAVYSDYHTITLIKCWDLYWLDSLFWRGKFCLWAISKDIFRNLLFEENVYITLCFLRTLLREIRFR